MMVFLAGSLSMGLTAIFVFWRTTGTESVHRSDPVSPYRNTLAGIRYLGDDACARCHAKIVDTFRQHPMGRSLSPIAAVLPMGSEQKGDWPRFEAQGFSYSVEVRDGHVIHRETRRDASGRTIAQNEAEISFVLGSGRQGIAYLIEHDGFLFESPITWYPQKRRWDLSPGYDKRNDHFDKPIRSDCLFCHTNRVEPVAGTVNAYRPPIFQGHAIGCERCHGPGELHVSRPTLVNGKDMTIVNPADLEPSLRDAVCEQCHLTGERRVVRAGRRDEDYRPALPFQRFWAVFIKSGTPAENRFVGQVEQMHESRCFVSSQGRLGCIACHDPHQLPAPGEKAAYYRKRCLECHGERGCSLPARVRLERSREDDCAGCHMPRTSSSDILHVATTDHRVPRLPADENRTTIGHGNDRGGDQPLINFHKGLMDAEERIESRRDWAVAMARDGSSGAAQSLPMLNAALSSHPDDVPAWVSKGFALGLLGRGEEGFTAFRTALTIEPNREATLVGAAYLGAQAGHRADAIKFWLRAITISPWRSDYRAELARLHFQGRDWGAAESACRETLRLNPANVEVRKLLVECSIKLGKLAAARSEFETLMGFDPPERDALLRWFAPQLRRQ
jgi:Flp pilus assembly protein TadD